MHSPTASPLPTPAVRAAGGRSGWRGRSARRSSAAPSPAQQREARRERAARVVLEQLVRPWPAGTGAAVSLKALEHALLTLALAEQLQLVDRRGRASAAICSSRVDEVPAPSARSSPASNRSVLYSQTASSPPHCSSRYRPRSNSAVCLGTSNGSPRRRAAEAQRRGHDELVEDLEDRVPAGVALAPRSAARRSKGSSLVSDGVERALPGADQQLAEARAPGDVAAQREHVGEQSDRLLELDAAAIVDRGADHDVVLRAVAMQQGLEARRAWS